MDEIDRLLAELKAKQQPPNPDLAADSPFSQSVAPLQSLDDLLSQIEDGAKQTVRAELSKRPPNISVPSASVSLPDLPNWDAGPPSPQVIPPEDPLLGKLKAEYEAQKQAEQRKQEQERREAEQRRQQEEREKQRRLEALRTQRRAELAQQAQVWLQQLHPRSEEGLWFEEFACNYPSRLEAAIEYLEALQSLERGSHQ